MSKQIMYDSGIVVNYQNLPDLASLHFYNTVFTLSSIPRNFRFVEDPNPPITTIVEEQETDTISLVP